MTPTPPSPAAIATTLASLLARHGLTRTYVAARPGIAVISITPALTAWTNGRTVWAGIGGQRQTWTATDPRPPPPASPPWPAPHLPKSRFPGSLLPRSGNE